MLRPCNIGLWTHHQIVLSLLFTGIVGSWNSSLFYLLNFRVSSHKPSVLEPFDCLLFVKFYLSLGYNNIWHVLFFLSLFHLKLPGNSFYLGGENTDCYIKTDGWEWWAFRWAEVIKVERWSVWREMHPTIEEVEAYTCLHWVSDGLAAEVLTGNLRNRVQNLGEFDLLCWSQNTIKPFLFFFF